jgi:hypothetical protein
VNRNNGIKTERKLSFENTLENWILILCLFHSPAQPNLMDAYMKSPYPMSVLRKNIIDALRIVTRDLTERPDSEKDNLERLAVIGRVLPMFSWTELKSLWEEVKAMDYVTM